MIVGWWGCCLGKDFLKRLVFNQDFKCSERGSCVTLLGESGVGEGNASAKVLRQTLSWCPLWASVQRWGLVGPI